MSVHDQTRPADDADLYVGPANDPNRYRLGDSVGTGGEGQVFHGFLWVNDHWQDVAIKVWRQLDKNDPTFEHRAAAWQHQLDLIQSMDHPGIVRMRGVFAAARPIGVTGRTASDKRSTWS
ncbi:hypothetical protein ACE2AJ_09840 [Aquihabitans daechungensis]|uniref:hypothetical protein n=1 Tax=Aquihabitans daechungensis TaxID=1052257 RepID=UPI003BA0EBDC